MAKIAKEDIQAWRAQRLLDWVGPPRSERRANFNLTKSEKTQISQYKTGYSFGEDAAISWEKRLGMPEGYLRVYAPAAEQPPRVVVPPPPPPLHEPAAQTFEEMVFLDLWRDCNAAGRKWLKDQAKRLSLSQEPWPENWNVIFTLLAPLPADVQHKFCSEVLQQAKKLRDQPPPSIEHTDRQASTPAGKRR